MSNGTVKKRKRETLHGTELFTDLIEKITGVYVMVMFVLFPLFGSNMYYNLLNDKYYVFFYSTAAVFGSAVLLVLIGLMGGAFRGEEGKRFFKRFTTLKIWDIFFLAFLFCTAVSTAMSEWVYESFWGTMGRLQGLFFYLICFAAYLVVTRFFRFRPVYLYVFTAVGVLLCLWGVTDYLGLDIFGWRADANDYYGMLIFSSSIGNVNTLTEVAALYAAVAGATACRHKNPLPFYAAAFCCFLCMITAISDNSVFAMAGLFGLLPFWCFDRKEGVIRYLLLGAVFFLSMIATNLLTANWTLSPVLPWQDAGVFLMFGNSYRKICVACVLFLSALSLGLFFLWKGRLSEPARGCRTAWTVFFFLAAAAVLFAIIDANTGGHPDLWEPFAGFLIFNDRWGTNRGYAWRSAYEFFKNFSFMKKLFGTGPETFAIFMKQYYYYDMINFMDQIFDSPHSEPVQYLFTTGIFGFLTYYGAVCTAIGRGIREKRYAAVFAFGLIAYTGASLIDISVPIATPFAILLLALCATVSYQDEKMA